MISSISTTLETDQHTEAPSLTHAMFALEFVALVALVSILGIILIAYTLTYGLRMWNTIPKHPEDVEAMRARKNLEF